MQCSQDLAKTSPTDEDTSMKIYGVKGSSTGVLQVVCVKVVVLCVLTAGQSMLLVVTGVGSVVHINGIWAKYMLAWYRHNKEP